MNPQDPRRPRPDDEVDAGNRQHSGENRQGGDAERIGDSLSGSIQTEDGNQQRAEHSTDQGARERALPTVPDESIRPLTEEELRLMADTMPGEGPGDD